jgi:hypothetical protein
MWEKLVVALVMGVLNMLVQRADLRARVLSDVRDRENAKALAALGYEVAHAGDPERFVDRVQSNDPGRDRITRVVDPVSHPRQD